MCARHVNYKWSSPKKSKWKQVQHNQKKTSEADLYIHTLLEDGEGDWGDQFKQGFDWRKMVWFAGKYVHHLKTFQKQDLTAINLLPKLEPHNTMDR